MTKKSSADIKIYDESNIFQFAFCGPREFFENTFLKNLASEAEEEKWSTTSSSDPYVILFYYITKTFSRCYSQHKIVLSTDGFCCKFNTGLLTKNGEDILGCFIPNPQFSAVSPTIQKWYFKGFFSESDRFLTDFSFPKEAELASYFDAPGDAFFDPSRGIDISIDHVLDDHWTDPQIFPKVFTDMGKQLALDAIKAAFQRSLVRIKRNSRLVVPQFYLDRLMFLMPIVVSLPHDKTITFALAVEPVKNGSYRANTIFDLESAYKKARLINRPESNWLMSE